MKKLIILLLTFSLALGAFAFTAMAETVEFFCDVNSDGLTDNLDAALILKYDAGIADSIQGGDANGDDVTDNLDAAMVLKYDAGLSPYVISCEFKAKYARFVPDKYFYECSIMPGSSPVILRSTKDLADYMGDVTELEDYGCDLWESNAVTFKPYEDYDEEYFENKILILLLIEENSGSNRNKVESVSFDNGRLKVEVESIMPQVCTDDMAYWTVFIELDKSFDVPREKVDVDYLYTYSYTLFNAYTVKPCFTPVTGIGGQSWPDIRIIKSVEEYDAYIAEGGYFFDVALPGVDSYNNVYKDCFTESYFENYVLVAIVTPSRSASTRYSVEGKYNVVRDVRSIDITVDLYNVDYDTVEVGNWHIMLSIEKSIFDEDILNVSFAGSENSEDYDIEYSCIRTQYYSELKNETRVITSLDQLTAYYEENKGLCRFDMSHEYNQPSFKEAIEKYDSEYFENKCLIIIPVSSGSGSIEYTPKSVNGVRDGDSEEIVGVEVKIEVFSPFIQTCDMARWHIIIEVDSEYAVPDNAVYLNFQYVHEEANIGA